MNSTGWQRVGCRTVWAAVFAACCLVPGAAQAAPDSNEAKPIAIGARDLTELSIEELMNIEVTLASKKPESMFQAGAAIYVVTQEDIRRSGATCIPEALRMVPGLHVARIDGNKWVVGCRGFSNRFYNKLLVLMDGRIIYTPAFGGVFWDVQDTVLEDIDRIEVIRGPGATLWGANAVNGIINIITKSAQHTQGTYLEGSAGSEVCTQDTVRYGAELHNGYYRAYAKYFNHNNQVTATGDPAADGGNQTRGGFRFDLDLSESDSLTVQGDVYGGHQRQVFEVPTIYPEPWTDVVDRFKVAGGNLLGRWSRVNSPTSRTELQVYYDRTERDELDFSETRNTFDIDFQRTAKWGERHEAVWGLGYRLTADNTIGTWLLSVDPQRRTDNLFSAFLQDEIRVVDDCLSVAVGSKFEHNDYTGLEIQPSVRAVWTPGPRQTVWGSIARAVRSPARVDSDVYLNWGFTNYYGPLPYYTELYGNKNFKSEDLLAYELGYRIRPNDRLLVDIATYYNHYDDFRSFEYGEPQVIMVPAPHIVIPITMDNKATARSYGFEIATNWQVSGRWRLNAGYTHLRNRIRPDPSSRDILSVVTEGDTPRNQFHLLSFLDLSDNVQLDTAVYYVGKLPRLPFPTRPVTPSYTRVDVRLAWQPREDMEVSFVVQNLNHNRHKEFFRVILERESWIERAVYGKVSWKF